MGMEPGGMEGVHVDARADQESQGVRLAIDGGAGQRLLPVLPVRLSRETEDLVLSPRADRGQKRQPGAPREEPFGRGDLPVREGRHEGAVGIGAGRAQDVDQLAVHPTLPRDPSRDDQFERVLDLFAEALHPLACRRPQHGTGHLGDVRRQLARPDRILRHEPEQVRSVEVVLSVFFTFRIGEAFADQPGVPREEI